MAGVKQLAPGDELNDPPVAYFFELECSRCGERTERDVCLYPAPDDVPSSPVCCRPLKSLPNSAHPVRKCKACSLLGSVELNHTVGVAITPSWSNLVYLDCIGYKPVAFLPGPGWTATTAHGTKLDVTYDGGSFTGYNEEDQIVITIENVVFTI